VAEKSQGSQTDIVKRAIWDQEWNENQTEFEERRMEEKVLLSLAIWR